MSENEISEIINRIKARRIELDLSYQELANKTGLSKSTLQRYETGYIKKVPINHIEILAKALNINPGYLMGWEETILERHNKTQQFSDSEIELIKKYRQLDADGKRAVDDMIDFKLFQQSQKDSSTENKVG